MNWVFLVKLGDCQATTNSLESFNGPAQLKNILLHQKRDEFVRCLTEKVLTFALGRGLEYYDKCAVDQITRNVAKKNYRFSALITEVIKSTPFQMRRGEQAPANVIAQPQILALPHQNQTAHPSQQIATNSYPPTRPISLQFIYAYSFVVKCLLGIIRRFRSGLQ